MAFCFLVHYKELNQKEEHKMVITVILFIIGLVLICLGGDRLVDAAVAIAKKLGIPQIVVGATIVSLGTTLPEILVSTTAAFDGSAAISAGNAFGSIICNTTLIAGLVQLLRPVQKVDRGALGWRAAVFFGMSAFVWAVGHFTGSLNRATGVVLLVGFCLYAFLNVQFSGNAEEEEDDVDKASISLPKQFLTLVICAAMLYVGAKLLVDNGIIIAETLGVPERVIAVTFIALGTSLPELMTSVMSIVKGYGSVGLGNVLGANILNLLLVLGIPVTITGGFPLEQQTVMVDIPLGMLVMAVLFVPILWKKKAYRIQGVALLAIYAVYCVMSFVA